jgi:exodeoxyribonuclease V gamma subunit
VRHALQPFSAAAFGAALPDEANAEPRRFSYDARWHPAAGAGIALGEREVFASQLSPREVVTDAPVSLAQLRGALMRPHELYLQQGLGLRLPEEEPALEAHEPFGTPDALARYGLRQRVFDAWRDAGEAPALHDLQARLLARGLLAPGADGWAVLQGVIEEVAPFAEAALQAGFRGPGEAHAFELPLQNDRLVGTLEQVHAQGVFRAALNPTGRHGGHALRHGLDWLVASVHGWSLHELFLERKGAPPRIVVREPLPPAQAREALSALLALRRRGVSLPLDFLPKSGHAWWLAAQRDPDDALEQAQKVWGGNEGDFGSPGEARAATLLALRGRDPFLDGDAEARDAFEYLSHCIFSAVEQGQPFDVETLP